jgi:hypothetical protein
MTMVALTDAVSDFVDPDSKTVLAHSVHSALEGLREAVFCLSKPPPRYWISSKQLGAVLTILSISCQDRHGSPDPRLLLRPVPPCTYLPVRDLMSSIETTSGEETGVEYSGDFLEDTKQATRSIQRLVCDPFLTFPLSLCECVLFFVSSKHSMFLFSPTSPSFRVFLSSPLSTARSKACPLMALLC